MPIYQYQNPNTGDIIEVVQKMSDDHVYIDDNGLEHERVWSAPNAAIGMNSDMDSSSQFVRKTSGWNTGDMWDYSKELSEKRLSKRGEDHVKNKHEKKRKDSHDAVKKTRRKSIAESNAKNKKS